MELFRAHPDYFDLVITDYTMPHMNGLDLARRLVAIRPDIPIMLCSGRKMENMEDKIRKAGVRAFLMKPLDTHSTAEAIRKVLDNKRESVYPLKACE